MGDEEFDRHWRSVPHNGWCGYLALELLDSRKGDRWARCANVALSEGRVRLADYMDRLVATCRGEDTRRKVVGALALLRKMKKGGGLDRQLGFCLEVRDIEDLGEEGTLVWGRDEEDTLKILHPTEGGGGGESGQYSAVG